MVGSERAADHKLLRTTNDP